jgi:regulator of chromosome condensation
MKTHLYVFGSGDCGQLGLGEDVDMSRKPRLHPFFENVCVTAIVAGGLHSLALAAGGKVYSWGCNDEKALGHDAPEFSVGMVEGLEEKRVVQVAAGDSISAALTEDGRVYTWGTFRDSKGVLGHQPRGSLMQERPTLIESLASLRVTYIAAGSNHLMAVTEDGQLYAWGSGEQGQLGRRVLERHKLLALRPTNVTPRLGRSKVRVVRVICGSYHTLVLAEVEGKGMVFAMGLNNFGQLGLADHADRMTAELVDSAHWRGAVPTDAGAGEHHSILLTSNGQIFSFGRTDSGQLGIEIPAGARACNIPTPVITVPGPATLIGAGGNHNLAVTDAGLFSWGYGEMHQLGHGPDEVERAPRLVQFGWLGRIRQVAAGGQHSVVLTAE